jgi:hypothetical protein
MRRTAFTILLSAGALFGSCAAQADGQTTIDTGAQAAEPQGQPPIKLELHPAAAPVPALRYRLLPPVWDLHRGNAALIYSKLAISLHGKEFDSRQERLSKWLEMPADDLPLDELRAAVDWQYFFDEVDLAAHCTECDWQLPLGQRSLISLVMPELQSCRAMAPMLAAKVRLQVAEGKWPDALRTLQNGFALGQHVAAGPTLVHGLVGIAISKVMCVALRDFLQHPDAPNLYWALTTLPSPLIDMRNAAEVESAMLYLSYPELRAIHSGDRTPRDWQAVIDRVMTDLEPLNESNGNPLGRLVLTAMAFKAYPDAKQRLIATGRPAAEVEAMPVFEVIAIDALATYDELRDRTMCWFYFPYWQARPHLEAAERYLLTEGRQRETIPLASQLIPAMRNVSMAQARADREVAFLRVIEAIRMHAAAHEGRLPQQLADITDVPLPIDPMNGKQFEYSLTGDKALLSSTPSEGPSRKDLNVRFELQLVK